MSIKKFLILFVAAFMVFSLAACESSEEKETENPKSSETIPVPDDRSTASEKEGESTVREDFVLIPGGTFQMGSPEAEAWRSDDENLHTVTVSDFYICRYELTQAEYEQVMGSDPSNFSGRSCR